MHAETKVCFLRPFNVFFCLSALSANYLGDNFVYLNWIVELFHYQTKMLIFFKTEVSLEVKVFYFVGQKQKFTHKLATAGFSSVLAIINIYGIFFLLFPEIFLIQKQHTCF